MWRSEVPSWAAADELGSCGRDWNGTHSPKWETRHRHTAKSKFCEKAEGVDQLVRRDSGGDFQRSLERRLRVAGWEMLWKRRTCR